ncbi:MAG TPA: indolepyruvate oxidoreductase subunit beta [Defluviitaleaceae bacterium]|jgi:indolepyruvate ferredoxin oxidoreductase beta subunit|nr:indolepyruvate oxidoreductase subunit beta [Candidatus Epulonipiscium sp.]HOA81092.1 indolepyruvate oxidoreductase subunit beta [Defluviitaleaceae bacterium]
METKNILIVGVGGQGTLLTSRIIGDVAVKKGYDVKMSEVHGMAQRGGSVVTHVRYGDKVYSPLVEEGTCDILLAFEKLEALRWIHYLKEDGIAIVNNQEINPMPVITGAAQYPEDIIERIKVTCKKTYIVDALNIAKELGNIKVLNTVLLGILSKHLGLEKTDWEEAIERTVPPKTIELNKKAFSTGYELEIK